MIISLCHTTARLPRGWMRAHEVWMKRADKPTRIQYILTVDSDRLLELEHPRGSTVRDVDKANVRLVMNRKRHCAVDGWNAASRAATGDLLISVSDDWFPPEHWDTMMLDLIPDIRGEYVLDVDNQDGSFPLLPFSLLTRGYYNRLINQYGYEGFFYPGYFGMMADCEFTDLARQDGVVIDARHMKFVHLNPERGSSPNSGTTDWDDTYRWQRRDEAINTGKEVYIRRVKELGIKHPSFLPVEVACS